MKRFLLSLASAAAMVTGVVVVVPAGTAVATHPCAQASDGTRYDSMTTQNHDACTGSIRPAPAEGTEVVLSDGDNGRTVTLALNQRLRVELGGGANAWDIRSEPALHRYRFDISYDRTIAGFTALSPTAGQQVTAQSDASCFHSTPACAGASRTWQVTVVVEDRADSGPSPSPQACTRVPVPQVASGTVLVEERQDGATVRVERGQRLYVVFEGCRDGEVDYQPAEGGGPLYRERAHAKNPGGAVAEFVALSTGTTQVHAVLDGPCLHRPNGCAVIARVWQVTVEVVEPPVCGMTGPAWVRVGAPTRLAGQVDPHATVQVWFRAYGASAYVARRQLTAAADGRFETSFAPVVDHRWYATSGSCTTTAGLTRIEPTASGPVLVPRGATVPVVVRGFAGQPVSLYARRYGGQYRLARTGRLDASGTFRTSFVADVDHRYYVRTGPDGRTSLPGLTQVR